MNTNLNPSEKAETKPMLAAGKMTFCNFQVSCKNCFEIIYQSKYFVGIYKNGQPLEDELKRVFAYPEFYVVKTCPCCFKSDFKKDYGYESILVSDDDNDDLPF